MTALLFRRALLGTAGALLMSIGSHSAAAAPVKHTVDIYRDEYGMAHLHAEREEDGFYGLGYAIGEDRLRQVLAWYVGVRSELAATFGRTTPLPNSTGRETPPSYFLADAVGTDRNALEYRLLETARRNFPQLPPQLQKNLRSYIAGLHAYMSDHPDEVPSWAPPLEPALPLAMFHLMVMEPEGICEQRRQTEATTLQSASAVGHTMALGGSNAWAVARERSVDRSVYFGSDSHSPIESYGTLFYPYRIKAGDLDFTAFDPAGSVMFFFGHSPFFAWGVTEGPRFVADCYRIRTEAKDPGSYRFDGKLRRFERVPYRIKIKGAPEERGVFEYTRHNGVLSPVQSRAADVAYAVSYASIDRVGFATRQYYRMAKAHSLAQLQAALSERDAYPANLLIAGADGTLMYIRPGRVPVRAPGLDVTRPLDGNTSATKWRGIHSYEDALKLVNPAQGYLANTNVSPDAMYPNSPLVAGNFPSYYAFQAGGPNARQERLIELLGGETQFTIEKAKAIAMDETIPRVRLWSRAFAELLQSKRAPPVSSELHPFLEALARFDGAFNKESRDALIHFELRRALLDQHASEVDALTQTIKSSGTLSDAQQQLLLQAIGDARQNMLQRYGRTELSWGDVHRVGRGGVDLPIGGARLVVGTASDGSPVIDASLRALNFRDEDTGARRRLFSGQRIPFVVRFGPDGVQSYAQTLLGVSDDPQSAHYSDQASLASDKTLRAIPLTATALKELRASRTTLTVGDF